ncbi:MAG TPA: carboxymuconolactone decarboxylase family protein [Pirellulales bacterium]
MTRLKQVAPEAAVGQTKEMLDRVTKMIGRTPNMHQVLATSPVALTAYLQLGGTVSHGKLTARDREQISLAISEANGCEYCLSAHSTIGKMVGLTGEQIRDARQGTAIDRRTEALLRFARQVLDNRGRVSDAELTAFREVGFDDEAVLEVITNVVLNVFTNFTNNAAQTEVDWPHAEKLAVAQN